MPAFEYFVSCRDGVAIVSWIGPIQKQCGPAFDQCIKDLIGLKPTWILINFRDVPSMDKQGFQFYAQFKKQALDHTRARYLVASMPPSIRDLLQEQGVFSPQEAFNNLAEAIQNIAPMLKKSA